MTTSALAGDSTVTCCWDTSGTSWLTTMCSVASDAESSAVPVPSLINVASISSGISAILLVV
ncbi:Uncharacterised protein [Mycobacterium tuberculosis]|uniref:Uncharacterized protein n=1 Tax=Mycobacterium tuberculosis TaxID=1773 RepID=A0A0T9BT23_MYCTX|nr:Uncharacterised protein [Mycobacterium tuberculosis]CFR70918.1 Uncharacterised protein [Mycobacterium tuberculosis]CFS41053.1 Uncharacterised protein [Mycobacterium tuberculosis]CKO62462.1 Uncharacterised protein [Mycobacterium tuberculosis]CKP84910.1 Uncharacterised protein [Mycobacterium tuberculosis]